MIVLLPLCAAWPPIQCRTDSWRARNYEQQRNASKGSEAKRSRKHAEDECTTMGSLEQLSCWGGMVAAEKLPSTGTDHTACVGPRRGVQRGDAQV